MGGWVDGYRGSQLRKIQNHPYRDASVRQGGYRLTVGKQSHRQVNSLESFDPFLQKSRLKWLARDEPTAIINTGTPEGVVGNMSPLNPHRIPCGKARPTTERSTELTSKAYADALNSSPKPRRSTTLKHLLPFSQNLGEGAGG
jgi:hypothetical protein